MLLEMREFEFKCSCCSDIHKGIPSFGAIAPHAALNISQEERESRVALGSDDCIIDDKRFFIRACLEIAVIGYSTPFSWLTWVEVSKESYDIFAQSFHEEKRSHVKQLLGQNASEFGVYQDSSLQLNVCVHFRDNGLRPLVTIEKSDHCLYEEQKSGISEERLVEIYETVVHG